MSLKLRGPDQPNEVPVRRRGMFRALSHRNFRVFWVGAFLSNVGTWMQAVAQGWLVLQLTNSALWLGIDAFMATAPGFFLTLAGGVFADLVDRRRLLLYTQVVAGLAAVALATLVWTQSHKRLDDFGIFVDYGMLHGHGRSIVSSDDHRPRRP